MNKEMINKIDLQNMFDIIKDLFKHIEHSFDIIEKSNLIKDNHYKNIVTCGMGGSAIGADFIESILHNEIKIPFYVNRNYTLPSWISKNNSLVIICSYSGNTEETVYCLNQAKSLGIKPIIISSGGNILNQALKNKFNFIKLPKGIQPRAAFGYSASLLLLILIKLGIIDKQFSYDLKSTINDIKEKSEIYSLIDKNNTALQFASKIYNKYPIIYGTPLTNVVSLRLRCQLAENAKILSTHFMLPEQNHNEIEGFLNSNNENSIIIWINDMNDHERIIKRINITSQLLDNVKYQYFFQENGDNLINRLFKLIYFFDWVSFYSAIYQKINPTPVNRIQKLKSLMSK